MRGLTDRERDLIADATEPHPPGASAVPYSQEESEILDRLWLRGLIEAWQCCDPTCGGRHAKLSPQGKVALELDTLARQVQG
jgi:hypothetical protein